MASDYFNLHFLISHEVKNYFIHSFSFAFFLPSHIFGLFFPTRLSFSYVCRYSAFVLDIKPFW